MRPRRHHDLPLHVETRIVVALARHHAVADEDHRRLERGGRRQRVAAGQIVLAEDQRDRLAALGDHGQPPLVGRAEAAHRHGLEVGAVGRAGLHPDLGELRGDIVGGDGVAGRAASRPCIRSSARNATWALIRSAERSGCRRTPASPPRQRRTRPSAPQ